MNNLVFLEPNHIESEPFTTSDIIAQYAEVQHHTITRLIRNHKKDFEFFGKLGFKIRPLLSGQNEKVWNLNEQQATLLITYLKNTEPVRRFKKELVRQFYAMRAELQTRHVRREELKPVRKSLTDVIQERYPEDRWMYKHCTDLAYKAVMGRNAKQIRKERDAPPRANAVEYLTAAELSAVTRAEEQIAVLLDMGMDYIQVKVLLMNRLAAKSA